MSAQSSSGSAPLRDDRTGNAKERAKDVASTAGDQAKEVAGQVTDQARNLASEASNQAREVMDQARVELRQQAEVATRRAKDGMRNLSGQLQALREGRPQDAGPVVQYLTQVTQKVDDMSSRLDRGGVDGLVQDLTRFARRRPGAFLLACAGTGFVMARVVRAQQAAGSSGSSGPSLSSMPPPQLADRPAVSGRVDSPALVGGLVTPAYDQ